MEALWNKTYPDLHVNYQEIVIKKSYYLNEYEIKRLYTEMFIYQNYLISLSSGPYTT